MDQRPAEFTPHSKLVVWTACARLGSAYGAAFGALFGAYYLLSAGNTFNPLAGFQQLVITDIFGVVLGIAIVAAIGALSGTVLGAMGGCLAGFIGITLGRAGGWGVAGLLGGVALGAIWGAPSGRAPVVVGALMLGSIGGLLGAAVHAGLRTGRSAVPGVERLAAIIGATQSIPRVIDSAATPHEVTPSLAPHGSGNETSPAYPASKE